MSKSKRVFIGLWIGAVLGLPAFMQGSDSRTSAKSQPTLAIAREPGTGKIIVNWTGKGVLKQSAELIGHFKPVHNSGAAGGALVLDPTEGQQLFRLESASGDIFSVNAVGYVRLALPPGLSLIANPLGNPDNDLSYWLPTAPDGAQVFKYTDGGGYEVSTFDAIQGAWSNPGLQIPIGTGFYFSNPSAETFQLMFVGDVLQGELTNPLPAGISTKGALVPQAGSINSAHQIPGQPGDEIQIYTNDQQGGGSYSVSIFDAQQNAWVPDLTLQVGQGFWIQKQNSQDWVRIFFVN